MKLLENKIVIVTGASRGIGKSIAEECVRQGATVIFTYLSSKEKAEALEAELASIGGTAKGYRSDASKFDEAQKLVDDVVEAYGTVDVLINNAALYGTLKSSRFEDIDSDQWDRAMNVNVKGVWNCCRAVVPSMREQKSGSIINIASLAAIYGMPYAADYAASKAAVLGLTRVIAREVGKDGIRVNSVAPSMVKTDSAEEFLGEKAERAFDVIAKGQILQKTLEVDDIYGTILYLASDQSKFVTGQTLMVDGGSVLL